MNSQQGSQRFRVLSALALFVLAGCRPGYMKASDLESKGQGPAACAKTCEDLGMRMAALVLVGDTLPGCVCQPVTVLSPPSKVDAPAAPAAPATAPGTPATPPAADAPSEGAAAATMGYVVIAAAIGAQQTQQERQRQAAPINY